MRQEMYYTHLYLKMDVVVSMTQQTQFNVLHQVSFQFQNVNANATHLHVIILHLPRYLYQKMVVVVKKRYALIPSSGFNTLDVNVLALINVQYGQFKTHKHVDVNVQRHVQMEFSHY